MRVILKRISGQNLCGQVLSQSRQEKKRKPENSFGRKCLISFCLKCYTQSSILVAVISICEIYLNVREVRGRASPSQSLNVTRVVGIFSIFPRRPGDDPRRVGVGLVSHIWWHSIEISTRATSSAQLAARSSFSDLT